MAITFDVNPTTSCLRWSNDGGVTKFDICDEDHDMYVNGAGRGLQKSVSTASITLVPEHSESVFLSNKTSGSQTWTLPSAAAFKGCWFTIIYGGAGAETKINPVGTDKIVFQPYGTTTAAGVGIKNDLNSHYKGDSITIISDGVNSWWAINQLGTWVSQ